jgi:DNA-directed RNA polymerase subunit RPC12/RpoP
VDRLAQRLAEETAQAKRSLQSTKDELAREAEKAKQPLDAVKAEQEKKIENLREKYSRLASWDDWEHFSKRSDFFGALREFEDFSNSFVPGIELSVTCRSGHSVLDTAMAYCPECGSRLLKRPRPSLCSIATKIGKLNKILRLREKIKKLREKIGGCGCFLLSVISVIFLYVILYPLAFLIVLLSLVFSLAFSHLFHDKELANLLALGFSSILLVIFSSWVFWSRRKRAESRKKEFRKEFEERINLVLAQARRNAVPVIAEAEEQYQKTLGKLQEKAKEAEAWYSQSLQNLAQSMKAEIAAWQQRKAQFLQQHAAWIRDWSSPQWAQWQPVAAPLPGLYLGTLTHPHFAECSLPLLIPFRAGKGLLVKASGKGREEAIRALQGLGYRLLTIVPSGKLRFTFIDPVGLGRNVSGLLNLKEHDSSEQDSLVSFRVWTESEHIRRQLEAIKEHISTVLQERLRDQYPDIETYNWEAGEVAVPYRVPMVWDFPVNFAEESAKHLVSIAQTGPQVGVFPVVLFDTSHKLPYDFKVEALERSMPTVEWDGSKWIWKNSYFGAWKTNFDFLPDKAVQERLIKEWGQSAKEGMRVEVPFQKMLLAAELPSQRLWEGREDAARDGLKIPLGPITARKLQFLELGQGTLNHGLIVGRTGSGKSNLMHVLITAGALLYPPDELRMYLIDLKTVEFVTYRDLPHAEAVAVDADREFALSVLEGVDQEMRQRMDQFKNVVANDLAEYRKKSGKKMPRILLIIDEFQVLFEEDDRVAKESVRLLDRLVRQGRAFGIHVLLGSQSLGAHPLPRPTLDQMAVRIALQCSEADSRLILAEDNPAARLLSRPGQAVYNSRNGLPEGNAEFQVALFSDEDRELYIQKIRDEARLRQISSSPIVFAGNEPARIELCTPLLNLLEASSIPSSRVVETWLGESVSIRPPVAMRWTRQAGNHLGIVTREEEEGVGLLMATVLGLCARYPVDGLNLYIADFSTADAEWAEIPHIFQEAFPHGRKGQLRVIGRRELLDVLGDWSALVEQPPDAEKPRVERYLFLVGLQRIRDLRGLDSFGLSYGQGAEKSPSAQLAALLRDGPEWGIHVAFWSDTVANVYRSLDRSAVAEIGLRAAGSMSETDSSQWLDSPEAARLNKPHRMIFYDDQRPGDLQKFRPYAPPNANWLKRLGAFLSDVRP